MSLCFVSSRDTMMMRAARVAVVGSGPAGFYAADRLLKHAWISVDMYERLPVPYGLVRFGVAPDHPEVKQCIHKFEGVAADPRFRLAANVALGADVSVPDLRRHYDAVLLATGADSDRELGIPGEHLDNVFGARSIVGWYNGHPDDAHVSPDLSSSSALIFGQGNVALDVSRMLLTPVDVLAATDISDRAISALASSSVRRVEVVGRRGPLHVAFTIKELRESLHVKGCRLIVPDAENILAMIDQGEATWSKQRARKRLMQLLRDAVRDSMRPASPADRDDGSGRTRELVLRFLTSPTRILSDADADAGSRVASVETITNAIVGDRAVPIPGSLSALPAGLVVRSIGYRGARIPGIPFDDATGTVPTHPDTARVAFPPNNPDNTNDHVDYGHVYAAGWVRTGPTGVIATTMTEAHAVADETAAGLEVNGGGREGGRGGMDAALEGVKEKVVTFGGWKKIDEEEMRRGAAKGKEREKIICVDEMIKIAKGN